MKIWWIGHSCFYIATDSGVKIMTDPYQYGAYSGAVKYLPVAAKADIVTISHHHPDHDCVRDVPGAAVFDTPGTFNERDVAIEGIISFHDKEKGAQRGKNVIFVMRTGSLTVVHFGDVGALDFDASRLKDADIAFVPIGGKFTIDHKEATSLIEQLRPRIVIPMHYKTDKLDFDIDTLDAFLEEKENVVRAETLTFTKETLPETTTIYVLRNQR